MAAVGCVFAAASLQAQITGQATWIDHGPNYGYYSTSPTGPTTMSTRTAPYHEQFMNLSAHTAPPQWMPAAGTSTFGPTVDVYCTDFYHAAYETSYNAHFTNLGANPGWVGVYTRNATLMQYLEAAYLLQDAQLNPANVTADMGAVWYVMTGNGTWGTGLSPQYYSNDQITWASVQSLVTQAHSNWNSISNTENGVLSSEWVVVTPDDAMTLTEAETAGGHQEFLTRVVTPEPATMLLLGTGLLVMMLGAGAVRRLSA